MSTRNKPRPWPPVLLPVQPSEPSPPSQPERVPPAGVTVSRGETVLLIDHDSERADVLRAALEEARFEVCVAGSVWEALKLLSPAPTAFTLILADPSQPSVTNLRDCLSSESGDPPLRFFSKASEEALRRNGHELQSRELLVEPFSSYELVQRVESWVSGGPLLN